MTTKVLNKLINICTNLDGGTTSSDSTNGTASSDSTSGATISTSIYTDEYPVSFTEGTEYMSLTADISEESDSTTITLTFTKTDAFDADKFTSLIIYVYNSDSSIINNINIAYDGTQFSGSTSISNNENGFVYTIQCTTTLSFPLSVRFSAGLANTITTYTISEADEVDSSNLLTFGAIDKTYVRKTESNNHTHSKSDIESLEENIAMIDNSITYLESTISTLQTTIEELTSRITALEST